MPNRWNYRRQQHSVLNSEGEIQTVYISGWIGDTGPENNDLEIYSKGSLLIETQNNSVVVDGVELHTRAADLPTGTNMFTVDGYLRATRVYNAVYNDLAECFKKSEEETRNYEDLKHLIVKITEDGSVKVANGSSDLDLLIGIVSDEYGYLLGGTQEEINDGKKVPVGLAGTLFVKMSNRDIKIFNRSDSDRENYKKAYLGKLVTCDNDGTAYVPLWGQERNFIGKIIGFDLERMLYRVLIIRS